MDRCARAGATVLLCTPLLCACGAAGTSRESRSAHAAEEQAARRPDVPSQQRAPGARTEQEETPAAAVPGHLELRGIVRAPQPSEPGHPGKKFRGVFLEADDGTRWVLDYAWDSPFREIAGARVIIEGQRHEPSGQALIGPHVKVTTARVVGHGTGTIIIEISGMRTLRGRFERFTWEPGTKLEGETVIRFVAESGHAYWLASQPPAPLPEGSVEVEAHRVELSPFVTRPGGPSLWIRTIRTIEP